MFPPAVELGVFELTAFWSLSEMPSAHWFVSAAWMPAWKPPAPPEPAERPSWPSLLQPQSLPPMSCFRPWSWSVLALFETSVLALAVAVWLAELGPEETFPPAVEVGAFALTAFWSLSEMPSAHWLVWAAWMPAWKPPAPPEPADGPSWPSLLQPQSLPPMFCVRPWSWSVLALFET